MEKRFGSDEEIEIDLREILYVLWRRLWLIILALIVGGGAAALYCKVVLTELYTSTSMVYIISKETTLTSLADLQIGSQLTKDYRVLVTSRPVLTEVIQTLGLEEDYTYDRLKASLVLENPADTRMLRISIEDSDRVRAKNIVDTVAITSSRYIGDIMEMTPPKIIEEGVVETHPSSPNVTRNILIGGVAAAMVVCFLIALQVILNDTIRSEEDVEKYLELSVLASVPELEENRSSQIGHKKGQPRSKKRKKA